MPLPFSFSTQRQSFDGETAVGTSGPAVYEVVMQQPPAHVSTEPLLSTSGHSFSPAPALFGEMTVAELPSQAVIGSQGLLALPPAPSPNQRVAPAFSAPQRLPTLVADALTQPPPQPLPQAPSAPLLVSAPVGQSDWAAQMEQLRNDIFGIAMNVSAMRDRVDRLDQRAPQAAAASLATLRGEIEVWLESHLNAAVEHCMHRIMNRMPSPPAAAAAVAVADMAVPAAPSAVPAESPPV